MRAAPRTTPRSRRAMAAPRASAACATRCAARAGTDSALTAAVRARGLPGLRPVRGVRGRRAGGARAPERARTVQARPGAHGDAAAARDAASARGLGRWADVWISQWGHGRGRPVSSSMLVLADRCLERVHRADEFIWELRGRFRRSLWDYNANTHCIRFTIFPVTVRKGIDEGHDCTPLKTLTPLSLTVAAVANGRRCR
jgi:hypothetical protein